MIFHELLPFFCTPVTQAWLNFSGNYGIVSGMNSAISPENKPGVASETLEPCSIIIFGASGDLTARKLIPAFYHLCKDKQMPPAFRIIGFARREKTDESWRAGTAHRPQPVLPHQTGG